MDLLKKIFGARRGGVTHAAPESSQFQESESTTEQTASRSAPRRELVQVVLRDTMRKHGIPSDWIDCRILSVVSRHKVAGMHVQFILRQGEDRLLDYVHAFQDSFYEELRKFEPRAAEWLFSLSWQFQGIAAHDIESIPGDGWSDTQPPEQDTQPPPPEDRLPQDHADELESDLKALYAIRDAAFTPPPDEPAPAKQP